jgi:tetratricopeptide (TPR) repeat protein
MATKLIEAAASNHVIHWITCAALAISCTLPPQVLAQIDPPIDAPNTPDTSNQSAVQTEHPATANSPNQATPPLTPLSTEQMGDLHMAHRRYQAALQTYDQVNPKSSATWNKIGIANQQLFINDEAKRSYEKALKLDPKNSDVLNNLGSIYYALKQYSVAEHYYRKALKIHPQSALIYKNLGTDLLAQDKYKKGRECYQIALAKDPEIFERSNILRIGDPTPAIKRGAINYNLAKSYASIGMPARAVDYLRMAIDEGYTDRKRVMADREFATLHGFTPFEQLLAEQHLQ